MSADRAALTPVVALLERLHADLDATCFGGRLGPVGVTLERRGAVRFPARFEAGAYARRADGGPLDALRVPRTLLGDVPALVAAVLHAMGHQAAARAGDARDAACFRHHRASYAARLVEGHGWVPAGGSELVSEAQIGFARAATSPRAAESLVFTLTEELAAALTLHGLVPVAGRRDGLRAFACDGCDPPLVLYGRTTRAGAGCYGCGRPLRPRPRRGAAETIRAPRPRQARTAARRVRGGKKHKKR